MYSGLCPDCKRDAEILIKRMEGNPDIVRRQLCSFSEKYSHKHLHYELIRLVNLKTGMWVSLAAFLAMPAEAVGEREGTPA